jgi:hypothetical protein
MGRRGIHSVFVGEDKRKERLGRRRRSLEDNIKMDLRETGWGCMDWINLA